jgi:hypothetical protein
VTHSRLGFGRSGSGRPPAPVTLFFDFFFFDGFCSGGFIFLIFFLMDLALDVVFWLFFF